MDENVLTDFLEELIEGFGVIVRYEAIKLDDDSVKVVGGLCLLQEEYVLIVNSNATVRERINTLATALKHFDLDQVYMRPAVREFLERIPKQ